MQSGADAIVTGNWSADLTLLIKAAKDADLKLPFYTYHAATKGVPTALAAANADNVSVITYWNPGDDPAAVKTLLEPFKAKYDEDFAILPFYTMVKMLSQAVKEARSTEPLAVAKALEGMRIQSFNGEVQMRKSDHQIQQGMWISKWQKVDAKNKYNVEKTGYTFAPVSTWSPDAGTPDVLPDEASGAAGSETERREAPGRFPLKGGDTSGPAKPVPRRYPWRWLRRIHASRATR